VRELVQLHGGRVAADSEGEGHGATFTVEIPAQPGPETYPDDRSSGVRTPGDAVSLVGVRVLVVEDEADARDVAVSALAYCGAEVESVSSTAEALARFRGLPVDRRPHVLVSDIGMPHEDGYDLIRRIRALGGERGGDVPAIAVTGYATPDDVQRALAAGYHMHIAKPIDPQVLTALVGELVAPPGQDRAE
jgi:CheY-like chemotaxis protein